MGNYITIKNKNNIIYKLRDIYNKHYKLYKSQFHNDFGQDNSFEDVFEIHSYEQRTLRLKTGILNNNFYSNEFIDDINKLILINEKK